MATQLSSMVPGSVDLMFVQTHPLTMSIDGRAASYRVNGVLLERLPVLHNAQGFAQHMLPVIRAVRRYFSKDPGFPTAKAMWDERKW